MFKGKSSEEIKEMLKQVSNMGIVKYGADHFGFSINNTKKSEAFAEIMQYGKIDEKTGKFSWLTDDELRKKGLNTKLLSKDLQTLGQTKEAFTATINGHGSDLSTTNSILTRIEMLLKKKENKTWSRH